MPEIVIPHEMGAEPGAPPGNETVAQTLLAHLLWPKDEEARDNYFAGLQVHLAEKAPRELERALQAKGWKIRDGQLEDPLKHKLFGELGRIGTAYRAMTSAGLPAMDSEANISRDLWM